MDDRNDANIAVIPICDSLSFSSSFRSSTKLRILLRQCRIFQKLSQASLVINTIRFFTIILIIGETRKSSYQRADSPFSSILLLVPSSSWAHFRNATAESERISLSQVQYNIIMAQC